MRVVLGMLLALAGVGACDGALPAADSGVVDHVLTVSKVGQGDVLATPDVLDCGPVCSVALSTGSEIRLDATAAPGWGFESWSGACSGNLSCQLVMDGDKDVTATFSTRTLTLGFVGANPGTVTSDPGGVDCSSSCAGGFAPGSLVTLAPGLIQPSDRWTWGGDCSGNAGCQLTMDQDRAVTIRFDTCNGFEPNETLATAAPMTAGTYLLGICQPGDRDFFAVTVDGNQDLVVRIDFANADGDLDMRLFDSLGGVIASSAGFESFERIERSLAASNRLGAGTYFVEVFGFNDTNTNNYMLALTLD